MASSVPVLRDKEGFSKEERENLEKFKDVNIANEGDKIVLPKGMSAKTAMEWLKRKDEEDTRNVNVYHELPCSPLDGVVAFSKALKEIYGWAEAVPSMSWFGPQPPTMVGVPINTKERLQVPWGNLQVPSIEGHLTTGLNANPTPCFTISGKILKKYTPDVDRIVTKTLEVLRKHSIYKSKAVKVDFSWMDERDFNPFEDAPQFIDLTTVNESDLILDSKTTKALQLGLFLPIEHSKYCREAGIPLKRGVMLEGPYGVGKTLASLVTALKATRNGWTFIYLKNVRDLAACIRFAQQYSPAVIFAEDVDRVVVGDCRDSETDDILNTLDGVDTKGSEIITVLTTNFAEKIDKAILRPGRIDTLLSLRAPDKDAAARLVKLYGHDLFEENFDFEDIGVMLAGKIPAVIAEVVQRAKSAALYRLATTGHIDRGIEGKVTEDDVIAANDAMDMHLNLLNDVKADKPHVAEVFGKALGEAIGRPMTNYVISHINKALEYTGAEELVDEIITVSHKG